MDFQCVLIAFSSQHVHAPVIVEGGRDELDSGDLAGVGLVGDPSEFLERAPEAAVAHTRHDVAVSDTRLRRQRSEGRGRVRFQSTFSDS